MTAGLRGRGRASLRRLLFGAATLLSSRRRGFFIPYRYAEAVTPRSYPALEPLFRSAEPRFLDLLEFAESHATELAAIRDGAGPARFDQDWFPRLDAVAAYTLVRREKPRRIVEIGSGHSTRFLARAVADGGLDTAVVAIDPAPRAPLASLDVRHERRLLRADDPALAGLGAGDILFVDSSHVAVPGSDVDLLVGDVLPRLPDGVLVHIHDILLPHPYPAEWEWRGYNEATAVAALLSGGHELVFSSHWIASRHPERVAQGIVGRLPLVPGARETSLWLKWRRRPAPGR